MTPQQSSRTRISREKHAREDRAFSWSRGWQGILCFALFGCGTGVPGNGGAHFEVRDSSGIEIVLNGSTGGLFEDTLRLEEDLRIGVIDGEDHYQFFQIRDIAMDRAGMLFVGNGMTGTVRLFSPEGTFIREFGGKGDGPGEVRRVSRVWLTGDSVVLVDESRRQRALVFAKDGDLVTSWRNLNLDRGGVFPRGLGPGGWVGLFIPRGWDSLAQSGDPLETDFDFVRLFLDEDSVGGTVVDLPVRVLYPSRSTRGVDWGLFEPQAEIESDGSGRLFLSRGHPYQVDIFDSWGNQTRSVRRAYEPIPVTQELVTSIVENLASPYDTMSLYPPEERLIMKENLNERVREQATFPHPDVLPCLRRLLVAQDGAFWVERIDALPPVEPERHKIFGIYSRATSSSVWDIFNAEGRFQGTVKLPPRFTPMAVEEGAVVGVQMDALDVEYVVRFRVSPAEL